MADPFADPGYLRSRHRTPPARTTAYPADAHLPHSCAACGEVNDVQYYRTAGYWLCRGCSRAARLTVEPVD